MKVLLPDSSELELPDGATGLDAARAIGPKLAEQAVLIKQNGNVQDLRAPLADGQPIQILTTRDTATPTRSRCSGTRPRTCSPRRCAGSIPGVKVAIGPAIENGFYYDFEFPEPIREEALERIEAEMLRELQEGRAWAREEISADEAKRRFEAEGETYKVELVDTSRGGHLPLPTQGRVHRSLPRSAPAGLQADQGDQADLARGRLLARRRAEHAADADLRHRVLLAGRSRRAPRAARAGEGARPPQARPRARPRPLRRALAGLAALAPEGDGDLERARGPAPARERPPRLQRGEDAAPLRHRALGHLGSLGEVPREHVPDRAGGQDRSASSR